MVKTCLKMADISMFLPFSGALWPLRNSENKSALICKTCSKQLDSLYNLNSHEKSIK